MKKIQKKLYFKNKVILQNGATYNIFSIKKKKYYKMDTSIYTLKHKNIPHLLQETRISTFLKKINK